MKKLFCLFIVFSLLTSISLLLSTCHAYATNENFNVSAQVTYSVSSTGTTHVIFADTLTNLTDKFYASSYRIHLGFQDMQNVTASDNGGVMTPIVTSTGNGENIEVSFSNPAFGKGKSISFSIAFDTKEVASLQGSIWEVNIPGLTNANDFSNFTVHIVVPSYFGTPTFIKPAVGNNSLTFTKDELGKSGISLAFGDKQVYAFHLTYNLKNTELFPAVEEIALPPNTSYQHIEIDDVSPHPINVLMDTDGNWLAQYMVAPSQQIKVVALGKA